MINQFYIDYIKAIENPDKVGWNGKVWIAPQYKGYDKNQRGYGIDIVKNDSAKRLTQNRPGQWLTEGEADKLMKEHLLYVYGAAQKHIEGFDNLSDKRKAALLGMLYRGDSVNKNKHIIDINEPDDTKFFESISSYYKSKGLNSRAKNSSNFFNQYQTNFLIPMKWELWKPSMKFKKGGQVRKMQTAAGGPLFPWQGLNEEWVNEWKFRTTPAAKSRVLQGKGVETDKQYTERRKKEETKRTWRSDAADIAHGIGEGVLALNPYTAIPYFGAKVGQDVLNGNVSWLTALNASVPLFHLSPQAVGLREATNVALEDAANAGSKTARNWRVAREIKDNVKLAKLPYQEYSPIIRTKIGDVEINNPLLYYRLGSKEMGEDFSRTGIVSTDGEGFTNPMFAQGRLWYGIPTNKMLLQGKGILFKTSSGRSFNLTKRNEEAPKTDLLVSNAEMLPANLHSTPLKWITTINGKTEVQNWGDRRVPATQATKENTVRYIFKPGYGYKKILLEPTTSLKFFERKPSKNSIVGTSLDYGMKDSKGINFIKQFFALLRINGKEYTLEGLKDAKNVQQGLPEYIQSYLNLNTIERAVRAMRKNGYSEREILLYVDKVNEVMNKVKVGMYSDLEYNAAGALDFGGFYNSDLNFISVNKDAYLSKPNFTPNYILKHEGRHLIDYNTSMTDDVINILEKAYDKDFLEIPKHKDAGSLKNYLYMDREKVTTNRDARDVLLSNLEKHSGEFLNLTKFAQTPFGKNKDMVDFLNELIQYAEPEDIINAVENSNGYGKKYINYLKKNNKLTSTKIEQLRLAMIHVPSYLLPITGGYTLYNLFNQPQLQYLKQGGKMNILEFLKNGSGIHIKEKNKGKFTSYCGGKVTDECILKGKNSSNPVIRKRATFAANARKWKHKNGGRIDFLSLGGIAKDVGNIVRNIGAVANSDIGKAGISMATNLFKGVSNAGKITDAAIAALEAIDARKIADRTRSFFEHLGKVKQNDINENPDLYVDGSIIHNLGGVNDENRIYTNAINSFLFDTSKYDLEKQLIMELAQAVQDLNTAQMAGSIFDLIQGLSTSIFGNKNKAAVKGTATGSTIGTTGTTTYVGTNGSLRLNNMLA